MTTGSIPKTVYLDEDVPLQLFDLLSAEGIQVQLAKDTLPLGTDDATHLKQCADNALIMVTQNRKDFQRLHWLWSTLLSWNVVDKPHAGILTIVGQQTPVLPQEWAPPIVNLILNRSSPILGAMFMWRPSTREWETLPLQLP